MGRILIIDDDPNLSNMLSDMVKRMGHVSKATLTLAEGLSEAASNPYDVIFLDVGMPDGSGLDAITQLKQGPDLPEVIIITGHGNPDGAEIAIEKGAWDYIEKPSSLAMMTLPLTRALQYRETKVSKKNTINLSKEGIIGESLLMINCFNQIAEAAVSDANVLLTGETGTGKELFARAIHNNGPRAKGNFVVVDCASLSDNLVESTLFGYEKGAFTGADRSREGLIAHANNGTLFLDEIGELPFTIQKSFLRVLQEKHFRPLGSRFETKSNFRLISATNRNLEQMSQEGTFRNDLLFRIRSLSITLPPLRNRREDIEEIAKYHLNRLCYQYGIKMKEFSPEFLQMLIRHDWPGNVRELMNVLERVLSTAREEPTLFPKHLPNSIRIKIARSSLLKESPEAESVVEEVELLPKFSEFRGKMLEDSERDYLQKLMSLSSDNIKLACQISGLSRSRLYELLKKYRIASRT